MDAELFANMLSDKSILDLKKLRYRYPQADMKEFVALLGNGFYKKLPLKDFDGRNLVYLESIAQVHLTAVKVLLTPQNSKQLYGMKAMEEIAGRVLPQGFGYEWTGMSFQEEKSHGQAAIAVGLAILLVYLILAALYANWILPLGVLLVIPLALFGTVAAIMLRGMDNNIYVQIGMLLLIAMSSKNALILVLYARRYGEQGMTAMQAAHKAASVRFRPILMSSLAYAVGALPMLWATGAGAINQQYLGTAVFGGMVATALLTVLYAPFFYAVFMGLSSKLGGKRTPELKRGLTQRLLPDP